jgi:hypothetical protein
MDQQPQESASDPEPPALDQHPKESTADLEISAVAVPPPEEPTVRPPFLPPRPSTPAPKKRRGRMLLRVLIPLVVLALGGGAVAWSFLSQAPAPSVDAHPTIPPTATATATPVQAPATPPPVNGTLITTADGLAYIDIQVGTGAMVKVGDTIWVHYTGWLQSTGAKIGSSYDDNPDGKPEQFILDQNGVIQGWVEGMAGMKVGGTRRLIIPPALAYGEQGLPYYNIPQNATLIFDVELVSIDSHPKLNQEAGDQIRASKSSCTL